MRHIYDRPILAARGSVRQRTTANAHSSMIDSQGHLAHNVTTNADTDQESKTE